MLDTARNPDVELLIPRIDRLHQPRIQLIAPVLSDLPQRKNHLNQIHPGALVLNCQGMKRYTDRKRAESGCILHDTKRSTAPENFFIRSSAFSLFGFIFSSYAVLTDMFLRR